MADKTINDFPEKTTLDSADFLLLDDTTSGTTKKVAADNLASAVSKTDLSSELLSADTPNMLKQGTDSLLLSDPDDAISADADNQISSGTDGKLYVPAPSSGGSYNARASAYNNTSFVTSTSLTEFIADTEFYDSDGWYDNTTGRFTPLEAGTYEVDLTVQYVGFSSSGGNTLKCEFRKNNSTSFPRLDAGQEWNGNITDINYAYFKYVFDMNGTTDYISCFLRAASSTPTATIQYAVLSFKRVY